MQLDFTQDLRRYQFIPFSGSTYKLITYKWAKQEWIPISCEAVSFLNQEELKKYVRRFHDY